MTEFAPRMHAAKMLIDERMRAKVFKPTLRGHCVECGNKYGDYLDCCRHCQERRKRNRRRKATA